MQNQTIGQMLAGADARFAALGGYRADCNCTDLRVDLVHRYSDGTEAILASAPLPDGVAGEDIAMDLLADRIGRTAAEATYFVVSYIS